MLRLAQAHQPFAVISCERHLKLEAARGDGLEGPWPGPREMAAGLGQKLLPRRRVGVADHHLFRLVGTVAGDDLQLGADSAVGDAGARAIDVDFGRRWRGRQKGTDMRLGHRQARPGAGAKGVGAMRLDPQGFTEHPRDQRAILDAERGHRSPWVEGQGQPGEALRPGDPADVAAARCGIVQFDPRDLIGQR